MENTNYWIDGIEYKNISRIDMAKEILKIKLHSYGFRFSRKGKNNLIAFYNINSNEELMSLSQAIVHSLDIKHIYSSRNINARYKQRLAYSTYKHFKNE